MHNFWYFQLLAHCWHLIPTCLYFEFSTYEIVFQYDHKQTETKLKIAFEICIQPYAKEQKDLKRKIQ